MPTARTPWSACNRVLEDKWHDAQLQAHRERLEAIRRAASVSADTLSAALAGTSSPVRVHNADRAKRAASTGRPAPLAKSQSPAAKSRQRQIERDNLVLINKILALDSRKPKAEAKPTAKQRPRSAHASRSSQSRREDAEAAMQVQAALTARDHPCQPLPDAPRSAASHALYTRRSVGAHVGFCEQNAPALDRQAGAARRRSSAQRRILDENKKLLARILAARTTVSRADWQRHEQEHRRLLGNISRRGPRPAEHELERLARSRSSAALLSGEDDVVVIGGGQGAGSRRQSCPLAASRSMPALPVHSHSSRASDSVVARMRRMVLDAEADKHAVA